MKKATTPAPTTPVSVGEEETDSVALGTIEGGPDVVEGYWNKPAETGDVAGNYFQKSNGFSLHDFYRSKSDVRPENIFYII